MSKDISKVTLLSYFVYFFMGCLNISMGVLIINVAKTYNLSIANLGFMLIIPMLFEGIIIFANRHSLEKGNLKHFVSFGLIAAFLGIFLTTFGFMVAFVLGLILIGVSSGILFPVMQYIIVVVHKDNKFSKLNIINFAFSVGGICGPFVLGFLLGISCPWQLAVAVSYPIIFILFYLNKKINYTSILNCRNSSREEKNKISWHPSIYLISIAILCYVLSEFIFSSWIVAYFKLVRHFGITQASWSLSIFWLFIMIGRFGSNSLIGKYIKIHKFIIASSCLALVSYLLIFASSNVIVDFSMIAITGIGYAGLYAAIFTYGIDQLSYGCPKLVSMLSLAGTIGVILAFPFSSLFVKHFGLTVALFSGLVVLIFVIATILLTFKDKKNPLLYNIPIE